MRGSMIDISSSEVRGVSSISFADAVFASIVFFAFIGFDIVATAAEETKNPQRDLPRGILASLAIVTVLYVAVSVVLSGMVHYTQLRDTGQGHANLATAFALNGVNWAAKIISIGALAGLTTVVMVIMLGLSRVLFAMSRDGLLPRGLARTGSHGTPVRIMVLIGVGVQAGSWGEFPVWYHVPFLIGVVPFTVLGGRLVRKS